MIFIVDLNRDLNHRFKSNPPCDVVNMHVRQYTTGLAHF